jgi:hypothetical protein
MKVEKQRKLESEKARVYAHKPRLKMPFKYRPNPEMEFLDCLVRRSVGESYPIRLLRSICSVNKKVAGCEPTRKIFQMRRWWPG